MVLESQLFRFHSTRMVDVLLRHAITVSARPSLIRGNTCLLLLSCEGGERKRAPSSRRRSSCSLLLSPLDAPLMTVRPTPSLAGHVAGVSARRLLAPSRPGQAGTGAVPKPPQVAGSPPSIDGEPSGRVRGCALSHAQSKGGGSRQALMLIEALSILNALDSYTEPSCPCPPHVQGRTSPIPSDAPHVRGCTRSEA